MAGLYLAARPLGSQRHLFQTVNYLFLKEGGVGELGGLYREGRTQIPLQFLVGQGGGPVAYEVYVASRDAGLMEDLARALEAPAYPLSLGPAFALGWAEAVALARGEVVEGWEGEGIGWWRADRLRLKEPLSGVRLYRDRFPVALNPDRSPKRVEELALEVGGKPLAVAYEGPVLRVDGLEGCAVGVVGV